MVDFGEEKLQEAARELAEKGSAGMQPVVYFLPGNIQWAGLWASTLGYTF